MLKLKIGFDRMVHTVMQSSIYKIGKFYQDITQQTQQEPFTSPSNYIQMTSLQQKSPKLSIKKQPKHPYFRTSSKKQQFTGLSGQLHQKQRFFNKRVRQQNKKPHQTIIKLEQQQHLLLSRKKKLLIELNQINSQLKSRHIQQQKINNMKKPQYQNSQQLTLKAQELVKRMNKQRHQFSQRRKKSIEQLNNNIIDSIQMFHQALAEEEKIKQIRRQQIRHRIDTRKINAIQRGVHVNLSQSVIKHFIDKAVSNDLRTNILNSSQDKDKYFSKRIKSSSIDDQNSQQLSQINPEHSLSKEQSSSKLPQLAHIKTQPPKNCLGWSFKSYQQSSFFQKLIQEQKRNKKLQYLKMLQKKRVNLKHKQYAEKTRVKAKQYASNSMFLT